MSSKTITIISSLLLLFSCTKKEPFQIPTKEFDLDSKVSITNSDELDLEVLGADNIFIYDSLLLITTNDPNGMLKIYNKNTLNQIASIASKGRGHNEFLGIKTSQWQHYFRDGDLIIPFQDYGFIKEINITQSILQHKTIVGNSVEASYDGDFRSVALNDDINKRFEYRSVMPDMVVKDKMLRPLYRINDYDKDNTKKFKVFNSNFMSEFPHDLYTYSNTNMYIHPHKNLIIQPFSILNYILFFDLDKKSSFAIHRSGTLSFNETLPEINDAVTSFSSCVCTDDFFLILYFADRRQYEQLSKGAKLLAFDWEGNLMGSTILDSFCLSIAFDSQTNQLYGLNPFNETVYKFDISDLLNK